VQIPSFQEVLQALPGIRMNVEAKDARAAPGLVEAVLKHGAQDRVLVAAEYERNRRSVLGYPGPWGASRTDLYKFFLAIHMPFAGAFTPSCDALQIPETYRGIPVLTRRFLREAHRRNLPIHVWTVDRKEDMERFLSMGVDGIQTDRPDRLAEVLCRRTNRPEPPGLREMS
jgi:glycerophosphoryl diester phosphodiesterase